METLFDPTSIGLVITIITTVLGVVAAVIEKYKNKDLSGALSVALEGYNTIVDLFDPAVPQTESQTEQLNIIPARTWKMTDANKEQLFRDLRNWGGEIRKKDLFAVIAQAEADSQVEYGIILYDHNGKIDQSIINEGKGADQEHEVYHAFVSYGNASVQNYDNTMAKVDATMSKTYPLEVYWYMTDAEKELLMSNIGYNNAKCITEAQATILDAEERQLESYYIGCGNRTFLVVKGNVTEMGANPKTEESIVTTSTTEGVVYST